MLTGITVIVIDKHPIIRWALKEYMSRHQSIAILDIVAAPSEALVTVKRRKPDIVVMDTSFPDDGSIEAIPNLIKQGVQVVAFSETCSWELVESFIKAGGSGFVPKWCPLEDLVKAIEAASQKKQWIAPTLRNPAPAASGNNSNVRITKREQEVISLIIQGLSSKQIADQLCLSINTIETHRKRIFKKLNVRSSTQLVSYTMTNGVKNMI
ncbi:MAG: response regulator transcription factor [Armatimonadota bacterium]|nr:response regulator transcription factor [bacterium]